MPYVNSLPALQGPPDITTALQMLSEGLQQRRERQKEDQKNILSKAIGEKVSTGDLAGASTTAFQSGDLATGLTLQKLNAEQKRTFVDTVAKMAASATDEQSWETLRRRLTQMTGQDPGDFKTGRQELINEAMTVPEIMKQQEGSKPPSGYQQSDGGGLAPIPGGPADPKTIQSQTAARNAGQDTGDAPTIAKAIINGDQPPVLTGLYRLSGPVRAELERQGFDFTKAKQDWDATSKLLATMNGAQQTRLRQAVGQVAESLPLVEQLADKWSAGGFPIMNKVRLEAAKQGALGPEAQSIATQLTSEIADLTSELGTVYKGGNSSTDESLRLAATQLSADWSNKTLKDAVDLVRKNITYRENSLRLGTAGVEKSQYNPMQGDLIAKPAAPADPTDENTPPQGVDPQDWKFLTPEERQQYIDAGQ